MTALYVILGILLLFALIGAGLYLYWFFYLKNKNNNNFIKQEIENDQYLDYENYDDVYDENSYQESNYEQQNLEIKHKKNSNDQLELETVNKEELLSAFYDSEQYNNLYKNISYFIDENYLLDEENYNYFFSILNIDFFDKNIINQKIDDIIFDFINNKIKIIDFMEYLTASIFVNKYMDLPIENKSKNNSEKFESITIENTFSDKPKSTTIKLHSDSKKEDFLKQLEEQNLSNIDLLNELKELLN